MLTIQNDQIKVKVCVYAKLKLKCNIYSLGKLCTQQSWLNYGIKK